MCCSSTSPSTLRAPNNAAAGSALNYDYRRSALWAIVTPVFQASANIPTVIWWNNFERIHLAVEDLECRQLLE